MRKLFGTDGIRGKANLEPITAEMALKLGRSAAHIFKKGAGRHRIVIGKDTRLSGYMLENALVAGICSMGVDAILVGPLPTPGIAFITRSLRADAGIVISASHNTYEDNGIKFFSPKGLKLADEVEKQMETMIFSGEIDSIRPTAHEIGKAFRIDDAAGRYVEFIKGSFPKRMTLEGLKIVLDCANGAAYKVAPMVFKELGAKVITFNDQPDGTNINQECGALHPDVISTETLKNKADVGISVDGDADRVIMCDEAGEQIDGDCIMVMCGLDMLHNGTLAKNTVVATVMSNFGLVQALSKEGGKVVRTKVGDRYVAEELVKNQYNLGGEQSGHIIFPEYNTTGDGLITALQVLALCRKEEKSLRELKECYHSFPQTLINIPVKARLPLEKIDAVRHAISTAENHLKGEGRVLVRYSGTELLARVMVEGKEKAVVSQLGQEIAHQIKLAIGV